MVDFFSIPGGKPTTCIPDESKINKKIWGNSILKKEAKQIEKESFDLFPENKPRGKLWETSKDQPGSIYFSVSNDQEICHFNHPFLEGIYKAWGEHCPIVLSPDMFWMLIIQAFSRHVYNNAEELRHMFVNFDGKKKLTVKNNKNDYENISREDWDNFLSDIVRQIEENTGKEIIKIMKFDYSTTDEILIKAGQVCIMSAMQKYFEYIMDCCGCGFPKITLEGSLKDWQKLLYKASKLKKYMFDKFIDKVSEHLTKIIETKKLLNEKNEKQIDFKFWKEMIYNIESTFLKDRDSLPPKEIPCKSIMGWLLDFFPFTKKGKYAPKTILDNEDASLLASETICTPFTCVNVDGTERSFNIYVGFMGVHQDKETFEIKPDIGYYVIEESHDSDKNMF